MKEELQGWLFFHRCCFHCNIVVAVDIVVFTFLSLWPYCRCCCFVIVFYRVPLQQGLLLSCSLYFLWLSLSLSLPLSLCLAVHNSSIGDLVTDSLTDSLTFTFDIRVTFETFDQSDEET